MELSKEEPTKVEKMESRLTQLRELRIAREKARLDKLREMNIKKYNKDDNLTNKQSASSSVGANIGSNRQSSIPFTQRRPSTASQIKPRNNNKLSDTSKMVQKTKSLMPGISKPQGPNVPDLFSEADKKPEPMQANCKLVGMVPKPEPMQANGKLVATVPKTTKLMKQIQDIKLTMKKTEFSKKSIAPLVISRKTIVATESNAKTTDKKVEPKKPVPSQIVKPMPRKTIVPSETHTKPLSRKSLAPIDVASKVSARKSLMPISSMQPNVNKHKATKSYVPPAKTNSHPPRVIQSASKINPNSESVFDRLYKLKPVHDKPFDNIQKIQMDLNYRGKLIKDSNLIINKRHTAFEHTKSKPAPVRRSISAVHFKRIPRSELLNCITRWSSSKSVNKTPLEEIDEDELAKHDKIISAVKSERKKVTFQRPSMHNGPTPTELQSRLKNWLQKRGKSIDSYHHLQCFGLQHLEQTEREFKPYNEENKENISMDSDSDNGSYSEAMNDEQKNTKWRRASYATDFDETPLSMASHEEAANNTNELLNGALNDLTDLLREGFDWEQSARWLREIRERFPAATDTAAYWECRAALEESQGNLPASVECWGEAIAKGTERTVVEANLDQLLDKFMKLKISPRSEGARREANEKLLDVKNVFKSTIIRFAVQQAKLRQSGQHDAMPDYTVTPVRRSNRLSHLATPRSSRRTPRTPLVQLCTSLRQVDEAIGGKARFVPNATLPNTP